MTEHSDATCPDRHYVRCPLDEVGDMVFYVPDANCPCNCHTVRCERCGDADHEIGRYRDELICKACWVEEKAKAD